MKPPFEFAAVYRVRRDFVAERDRFSAGEVLVYWRFATSVYDGMQGYFFKTPGSDAVRSWDIPLGDDAREGLELFEPIAGPAPVVTAAATGGAEEVRLALPRSEGPMEALVIELALERAVEGGHLAALEILLGHPSASPAITGRLLHLAAGQGRAVVVLALLDRGVPVDVLDDVGQTPLIHAAANGDPATAAALLARGADPTLVTSGGTTPRSLAAARGHRDVVELIDRATQE